MQTALIYIHPTLLRARNQWALKVLQKQTGRRAAMLDDRRAALLHPVNAAAISARRQGPSNPNPFGPGGGSAA